MTNNSIMPFLLNWFQVHYTQHKKALQQSEHNLDHTDTNPFHIEGDCWSHTMLVCKMAEIFKFDKIVQISALLHDIAKPKTRMQDKETGYIMFPNHEEESSIMAIPLLEDLVEQKIINKTEMSEIIKLISYHADLYKNTSEELYERFKNNYPLFIHLTQLAKCDNYGRFSPNMGQDNIDIEKLTSKIKNYYNKHIAPI